MLLNGDEATMDLGRLGDGRRFAIGVGVGLDATMISEAPARLKKHFGFMAYVIGGYKAVLRNQKFRLRLTVDGVVYERTASAILVANLGAQNRVEDAAKGLQPRSVSLLQVRPGIPGRDDTADARSGRWRAPPRDARLCFGRSAGGPLAHSEERITARVCL
jgi:hypothetical protein